MTETVEVPIKLVMYCPAGHQHVDEGEWATKPHKTHLCVVLTCYFCGKTSDVCGQDYVCDQHYRFDRMAKPCGLEWRPSDTPTVGVREL